MAVNARDAMPGGGKLTITTSNIVIGEREAHRDPDTVPGEYVRLSIADSGVGMDAATAARVFDPFFTTKDAGKGTGLGLAMCYGIAKQAGGQILVQTAPGQGTTFHVDLPRALERVDGAEARDRGPETPGGRETILLVEDEVQVRRLAGAVLRQRGYEVLEAPGGPEAIQLAGEYHGRIDALVTDVVMPQMRGTEVARALTAMRPALKVLYMSGYTDDDRFRQEAGSEAFAFLAKPFTPTALARRVREVLDASV
jgi:CheY-like chemotaxis protein